MILILLVATTSAFAQPMPAARPANPNPDIAPRPTIVIPYDDPKNPLAAERVFLPHGKFVELWNAAHPERRVKAPAPRDGSVAEALLVVVPQAAKEANKPEGSVTARLFARLTLFSFREQQIVLPLPLKIASLTEARLDEQPAPLVVKDESGSPRLHVVIDKPGLHVLDLTAELPIQQAGPAGQLSLSLDPLPSGRLLFVSGADANDITLRVNGASNTFRVRKGKMAIDTNPKRGRGRGGIDDESAKTDNADSPSLTLRVGVPEGEVSYFEIPISAGGEVRLAWQPKQAAGAVDAIVQADSAMAVQVEDAGVRIVSGWQFRVPRGSIADVPFTLPKELRVRSIAGPDVGGWELADNADGRTLRVFLRRAVSDQTALTFELFLESRFGTEPVSVKVPQFAPLQVTRDFGLVGVFAAPQFALRNVATKGLTQINVNQFQSPVPLPGFTSAPVAPALVAAPLSAFRYTQRPFELSFTALRKAPESTGFAEHALVVERRKVRMSSRLRWDLTGALRSSVSVQLPQMWLPVDVDATALQDWHIDPLTNVLTVEFTEPRVGAVEIVLQGNVPKEPEDAIAEIIAPVPLELSKLTTQAAIWFDPAYKATLTTSTGWKTNDPEQCTDELKSKLGRPAQFLLHSANTQPDVLAFDIARAVPKLSADAVTLITVSDTAVDYSLALQWQITEAAADTLIFTTSDWLAGKLDFQGAGIRQTAFAPAGNGRTRWTVTLQDPIGTRYFLLATATLPPPEKGRVLAPTIGFERQDPAAAENAAAPADNAAAPAAAVLPLDTQRQFAVLINMSSSQLSQVGSVGETVPREELPIVVDQRLVDQATAVLRLRQLSPLPTWSLKSYATQAGAPASVNLADLVTVLAADGTWRMQAIYTIKNRSRQFLALQLPEGSQALSVFVADQPSRLVALKRGGKTYQLVALPKTSEADLSFPVKLVLAGRLSPGALPRGLRFWSHEFDLPVPTAVSQSDDAEYGLPVARTLWSVHVPKEWSAESLDDPKRHNLTAQAGDTAAVAYVSSWLQEANDLMRVIQGNYQSSQKLQAMNNLKQSPLALHNYRDPQRGLGSSEEGRKVAEQVQQFQAKQQDLELRVIIDQRDGTTNFYVAKDQQQAAQARAAQGQPGQDENARLFFDQLGANAESFQRQVVTQNNDALLLGNSISLNGEDVNGNGILDPGEDRNNNGVLDLGDISGALQPDGGLKFKLNVQHEKPGGDKKSERSPDVSQRSKASAGKGVTEEDRLARRKQSVEQLDQLNKEEENKRQQQQLANAQPQQQAAQPQGQTPSAPRTPSDLPPGGSIIVSDGAVRTVIQGGVDRSRQQFGMNQSGRFGRASGLGGNLGGGGGGFGGGLGGAGVGRGSVITDYDGEMSLEIRQTQTVHAAGWTQAGGLSLPIEIQREGNVLRFSRASGSPRLALAVRPVESSKLGLGLLWTVVWAVIAAWLLRLVSRASTCCPAWFQASSGASVLGLLGMFFLPSPLSQLCFLAFAISAFVLAIGLRRSTRQNAATK